jgi:heterotetrameric sarcosine oxidase gamma subunit
VIAPTSDGRQPVARSPLETVHATLGATWVRDDLHWPVAYGDTGAEATAVATGAGLAELGPIDKVVVRGRRTGEAMVSTGIPIVVGAVGAAATGGIRAWCLGDDEVILLGPTSSLDPHVARIRAGGAAVTEVSSGFSVLRLVGPASPAILERTCPVDLSPSALANDRIVQAPVAGVRMIVARDDHGDLPGWTLLVARDLAEYAWGALRGLGRDLRLVPVGSAAVSGDRA